MSPPNLHQHQYVDEAQSAIDRSCGLISLCSDISEEQTTIRCDGPGSKTAEAHQIVEKSLALKSSLASHVAPEWLAGRLEDVALPRETTRSRPALACSSRSHWIAGAGPNRKPARFQRWCHQNLHLDPDPVSASRTTSRLAVRNFHKGVKTGN